MQRGAPTMKIPSVKGFRDVLPSEGLRWDLIEREARRVLSAYGYREIRLPVLERTDLFLRSIGATTDIVEKEMYTFTDRDGTSVTLRPEGTASVARAYVEHAMHLREPVTRWFYRGPMFRRERPQKGRYRQFHQIGVELIGRDDPASDAEVLALLWDLLEAVGLPDPNVLLNTLGCRRCRPPYRERLVAWGREHMDRLCDDCRRRIEQNPLRLLDCKRESCVALRADAPRMLDHACDACRRHLDRVVELLRAVGREPSWQPYMVRGLDYYCRTAFEVVSERLGAQDALGGGGRYDGLVADLGGPDVAGIGFALGVERLAMVLEDLQPLPAASPDFVVVPVGGGAPEAAAFDVAARLRRSGAVVVSTAGERSLKSQMRQAARLGAPRVLIVGEDELQAGALTVRDMLAHRDHPRAVPMDLPPEPLRAALDAL